VQQRTEAGLPCDDEDDPDSLSAVDFLHAALELELPQSQWPVVVKLLHVPLRDPMQRVLEYKRQLRDSLAVLPLPHGAFAFPTWLIGLLCEIYAPQLERCIVSESQRYLVIKLGGDGTSGFKVNGAPSNIETINLHPLSITTNQCRSQGAMSLLGVAIAPEDPSALAALWHPIRDLFCGLPRVMWGGSEWRRLVLHTGVELLLSLNVGADGGCAMKLLGLSNALTRRDTNNPACCVLCDASYDEAVRLECGDARLTAVQMKRGAQAQADRAERAQLFNTSVRPCCLVRASAYFFYLIGFFPPRFRTLS
jgi:hypothetical protein